jgi:hypothetical protein
MKRPSVLILSALLLLSACSPAATPAPQAPAAQKPAEQQPAAAQPTTAPAAPAMPAQPAPATYAPRPTAQSKVKPPQSGGVLNPPTIIPTLPGNASVTSGQQPPASNWNTYRDEVTGLSFKYPRGWQTAVGRGSQGTTASIVVARPNQPVTNTVSIVIDVRKKQGDLLAWLSRQLPTGSLLIDTQALESAAGTGSYNAQAGNSPAVFLYAPAHGRLDDVAELHIADQQYFYQVTYLGSMPDNLDNRAAFLHLLNTLTLSGTTSSGVKLPATRFVNGVDPAKWK